MIRMKDENEKLYRLIKTIAIVLFSAVLIAFVAGFIFA